MEGGKVHGSQCDEHGLMGAQPIVSLQIFCHICPRFPMEAFLISGVSECKADPDWFDTIDKFRN